MQLDHNQYNNQCDTYQKTESTNQYHNHLNNQKNRCKKQNNETA